MLPELPKANAGASPVPRDLSAYHEPFADTEPGSLAALPAFAQGTRQPGLDLGAVTRAVLRSVAHTVPRERVEQLLADLLEQEFGAARGTQFMPVFLHRVACEALRREAGTPPPDAR